ncbi:hypothetical protein JCM1841_002056 [Sporobolomyces salmonicolor]
MVLQNKYKQQASRRYQRAHQPTPTASPSDPSDPSPSTSDPTATPRETAQERALRLGSNVDRYRDDDPDAEPQGEDEVDEAELARQAEEQAELSAFLDKQRSQLANPVSSTSAPPEDDTDVDYSFAHLRSGRNAGKGKAVAVGLSPSADEVAALQGEARRAQAVRDLKDRLAPSSSRSSPADLRKPAPLPNQAAPSERRGESFLDSLL